MGTLLLQCLTGLCFGILVLQHRHRPVLNSTETYKVVLQPQAEDKIATKSPCWQDQWYGSSA
jgi:hypothetical protein